MEIKTSDLVFILSNDNYLTGTVKKEANGILFETKDFRRFFNFEGKLIWAEKGGKRTYGTNEKV